MPANRLFQLSVPGQLSFLYLILQVQCHEKSQFGNASALQVVILQLDSDLVVEVKNSFACSTELDSVTDHVSVLSSYQGIDCPVSPFRSVM